MRLLSITLTDVRRFTAPVTVRGLGAGVNVLTAPNESGKSTLFDALQALFFSPHRSRTKEVRSLLPHAGGRPEVSVEIELPSGRFRVTKRWLTGVMAEVRTGDRLVAQGDAAEEWISAQVRSDEAGGPAGLLWVRQGLTSIDGDAGARRDLLSSVAGEVEAMTGGRRMDLAMSRCAADLSELITPTGRSKAGGPLKTAEEEVEALEARETELAALSREISEALTERRGLRREAAELKDPEEIARGEAELAAAQSGLNAARQHAEMAARAADRSAAARQGLERAVERRDALSQLIGSRETAEQRHKASLEAEMEAISTADKAKSALTEAEECLGNAQNRLGSAERELALVAATETAERNRKRLDRLETTITTARHHAETIIRAGATARGGPDQATMSRLDRAHQELRVQEALRAQAALTVTVTYDPQTAPPIRLGDGTRLDEGAPHPLPDGGELLLDGIGRLLITPGSQGAGTRPLDEAREEFDRALQASGSDSLEGALRRARVREAAETELAGARAALGGIAPDGVEVLEAERTALITALEAASGLGTPQLGREEAERVLRETRGDAEDAKTRVDAARGTVQKAEVALATATALREAAEARVREVGAALDGIDLKTEIATRNAAVLTAQETLSASLDEEKRLTSGAPDLLGAEAAFRRARSALEGAAERLRLIERRLAALDEKIALRAGEGVDEELAEVRDRLDGARARLARFTFERDLLLLLQEELEAARASAREHYFEPVTRELKPLLQVLWPDAELVFDDETLLPTALIRNGQREGLEALSGGTREQVALLVRLAFARLLGRAGRAAPVILDDALIFTDDERITRMFEALHRQAEEMQILVLSCRQRAFRSLGGSAITFEAGAV